MKPNKFRPGAFRWDDDLDPEKNERVKRDVEIAMKPIVEINSEIQSKFTNLQVFISDMIDQNIKLMKNTCERQLNGYKSQKRRLKGFIERNCLVFESQPDVISLQTEIQGLRSKVKKLEERALCIQASYETTRKIAYEKNELVKALRKDVRESHKNALDTKYQVYNHSAKYLLLRYNMTPQPKATPRLHKRSQSSQYSPRELRNLPYLVPKQVISI
jgi:hypothetical protein